MSRGVMRRMDDVKEHLRSDITYGKVFKVDGEWKYKTSTKRGRKVPEEVGYLLDHFQSSGKVLVDTDGKVHWNPK